MTLGFQKINGKLRSIFQIRRIDYKLASKHAELLQNTPRHTTNIIEQSQTCKKLQNNPQNMQKIILLYHNFNPIINEKNFSYPIIITTHQVPNQFYSDQCSNLKNYFCFNQCSSLMSFTPFFNLHISPFSNQHQQHLHYKASSHFFLLQNRFLIIQLSFFFFFLFRSVSSSKQIYNYRVVIFLLFRSDC